MGGENWDRNNIPKHVFPRLARRRLRTDQKIVYKLILFSYLSFPKSLSSHPFPFPLFPSHSHSRSYPCLTFFHVVGGLLGTINNKRARAKRRRRYFDFGLNITGKSLIAFLYIYIYILSIVCLPIQEFFSIFLLAWKNHENRNHYCGFPS